jgi:hypothetical protein
LHTSISRLALHFPDDSVDGTTNLEVGLVGNEGMLGTADPGRDLSQSTGKVPALHGGWTRTFAMSLIECSTAPALHRRCRYILGNRRRPPPAPFSGEGGWPLAADDSGSAHNDNSM